MNDLRFAVRQLAKSPGFTAVAVLTLALGIGVNSAVFTLVDHLALRPLIPDRPEQVVTVERHRAGASPRSGWEKWSYRDFVAVQSAQELFSDVAAVRLDATFVGRPGDVRKSYVAQVSGNYFGLLGAGLLRGRIFSQEEAQPDARQPVLVASYSLWQRFGGREDFVGGTIRIGAMDHTVIGIARAGFNGTALWPSVEAWLPLGLPNVGSAPAPKLTAGPSVNRPEIGQNIAGLTLLARLQPTLTPAAAEARATVLAARFDQPTDDAPTAAGSDSVVKLLRPSRFNFMSSPTSDPPWVMVVAPVVTLAAAVLLIASLNLANLLLARGVYRRKEIAIRLSLGASRARVVRQLLVEGLTLAVLGSALGLLFALWTNDLLVRSLGGLLDRYSFSLNLDVTPDARIVLATLAYGVAATLVFSLWPALRTTRVDLNVVLNAQAGQSAGTDRWQRFFSAPHCLAMAQVTLSLLLLHLAGASLDSMIEERKRPLGFETAGRLVATIEHQSVVPSADSLRQRLEAMCALAERLPGVERAVLATSLPFGLAAPSQKTRVVGAAPDAAAPAGTAAPSAIYAGIGPGFFETLGIPLLRGRDFTAAEIAQRDGTSAAIIDETLARQLFGDRDPLGLSFTWDNPSEKNTFTVVGLVRSPAQTLSGQSHPARVYLPLRPPAVRGSANLQLVVKLRNALAAEGSSQEALARGLRKLDPELAPRLIQPLQAFVAADLEFVFQRFVFGLMGILGALALLLAAIGNFGIKAYLVANRTKEIGIRMALGARAGHVVTGFMQQSLWQMALAGGLGASLSFGVNVAANALTRSKDSFDWVALGGASLLLLAIMLLACWLPARRATRVNPVEALRAE